MTPEFRNGMALSIAITAFAFVIIAMVVGDGEQFSQPSFEVIDTYKGCDIVRYAPHQAAEYKYFLYCENDK
jgi:hypothetical protein